MKKKGFQIGFGIAAFAVFWLLMGAAAPMPVLRNKWTTNNDLSSIIGNWTYSNRAANTTNFLRYNATGFGAPSLSGGDIWFLYGQGGIQAMTFGQGGGSSLGTNGGITLVQTAASNPLLRLVGASGQTGNILESQNDSGGRGFIVNSNAVAGTTNITGSFAPVPIVIFKQTAESTITNTLVETSFFGTGSGSRTISGGILSSNSIITWDISGRYALVATAGTLNIKVGGVVISPMGGTDFPAATTAGTMGAWRSFGSITLRSTNTAAPFCTWNFQSPGTLGRVGHNFTNTVQTVNFAIDQLIDVSFVPVATTASFITQQATITVTP